MPPPAAPPTRASTRISRQPLPYRTPSAAAAHAERGDLALTPSALVERLPPVPDALARPTRAAPPLGDPVATRTQQPIVPTARDVAVARAPVAPAPTPIAPVPLRPRPPVPDRGSIEPTVSSPIIAAGRAATAPPGAARDHVVTPASPAVDDDAGDRDPGDRATGGDALAGDTGRDAGGPAGAPRTRRAPRRRNIVAGRAVVVAWAMSVGTGLVSVAFAAALVALELLARAGSDDAEAAYDRWERIDGMAAGAFFASTVPWLAAFTVLAAWMYVESRAQPDGAAPSRWGGAWTIAVWFVPVANLLVPRLVMAELERRRTRDATLWVGGHLWWFAWLTGGASLLGGLVLSDTDDIGTLRTSYGLLVVGFALLAAGWGLLGALVRRIDRATPEPVAGGFGEDVPAPTDGPRPVPAGAAGGAA